MQVLGIETSCDETGVAIYSEDKGLLAHEIYSQIDLHAKFGGVVPELASRDHIKKLIPLVKDVMHKSKSKEEDIVAISYTQGPGLLGPLMVGASFAKALSYAWGIPSIGVHHMEAHLLAPMLEKNKPEFPFIALLVSGGHSMLIQVNKIGNYKLLGDCLDDAAGEAFDKIAKLLGLGYPGGPAIEKLAKKGKSGAFSFPMPLCEHVSLDFSFSGLKTHAIKVFKEHGSTEQGKANIALAFQEAVINTLFKKCNWALEETGIKNLVIAGGVSANQALRAKLGTIDPKRKINLFFPRHEFCTDNGAMVAYTGMQHFKHENIDIELTIDPKPRWKIETLTSNLKT